MGKTAKMRTGTPPARRTRSHVRLHGQAQEASSIAATMTPMVVNSFRDRLFSSLGNATAAFYLARALAPSMASCGRLLRERAKGQRGSLRGAGVRQWTQVEWDASAAGVVVRSVRELRSILPAATRGQQIVSDGYNQK